MIEQTQSKLSNLGEEAHTWFIAFSIFGILMVIGMVVLFFLQTKVLRELRKITKNQEL